MCDYISKINYCTGADLSKILRSMYGSVGEIQIKARKGRESTSISVTGVSLYFYIGTRGGGGGCQFVF